MGTLLACSLALGVRATSAAGAMPTYSCRPAHRARAVVLILHPGAFIWDYTSFPSISAQERYRLEWSACRGFARDGMYAVELAYPLDDYRAAVARTVSEARALRQLDLPVFAYGESAGGTLAEILALRGDVAAAVSVAGIADLGTWQPTDRVYWRLVGLSSRRERTALSPIRIRAHRCAALLLLHSPADRVVPFNQSVRLATADRCAALRRLRGDHLADPNALDIARAYLRRRLPVTRARTRQFSTPRRSQQ